MHIHISSVDFLKISMYIVIFGFFWRTISMQLHGTALGKAMAYIF